MDGNKEKETASTQASKAAMPLDAEEMGSLQGDEEITRLVLDHLLLESLSH